MTKSKAKKEQERQQKSGEISSEVSLDSKQESSTTPMKDPGVPDIFETPILDETDLRRSLQAETSVSESQHVRGSSVETMSQKEQIEYLLKENTSLKDTASEMKVQLEVFKELLLTIRDEARSSLGEQKVKDTVKLNSTMNRPGSLRESTGGIPREELTRKPEDILGFQSPVNPSISTGTSNGPAVTRLVTDTTVTKTVDQFDARGLLLAKELQRKFYAKRPEVRGKIPLANFFDSKIIETITNFSGTFDEVLGSHVEVNWYESSDEAFENAFMDYIRPETRNIFKQDFLRALDNFNTSAQFREERMCRHGDDRFAELRLHDFATSSNFLVWAYNWLNQAVDLYKLYTRNAMPAWIKTVVPQPGLGRKNEEGIIRVVIQKLGPFSQSFINMCGGKEGLHDKMDLFEFRTVVHKFLQREN